VFERFELAGDSRGGGLGLSIARDLVRAHGGAIDAGNDPTTRRRLCELHLAHLSNGRLHPPRPSEPRARHAIPPTLRNTWRRGGARRARPVPAYAAFDNRDVCARRSGWPIGYVIVDPIDENAHV
jgi:signal transduction histidine kinase